MDKVTEEKIQREIEHDQLQWKIARERALEIVRDLGWTEKDDDYALQVEEETFRQWSDELDREIDRFFGFV